VFTRNTTAHPPARFDHRDPGCGAGLTINPLRPGHLLDVPRAPVDHWFALDPDEWHHLTSVAQRLAVALQRAYEPTRVGMMLAGLEVPHVHIHVVPIDDVHDLDFGNADPDPDPADLDAAAEAVRAAVDATSAG
jgi:histidine triad (HIT) family protein